MDRPKPREGAKPLSVNAHEGETVWVLMSGM